MSTTEQKKPTKRFEEAKWQLRDESKELRDMIIDLIMDMDNVKV